MAGVSTYLNFPGNTAAAFEFYRSVFGTEFQAPGIQRMSSAPAAPGQPPLPEAMPGIWSCMWRCPSWAAICCAARTADESMGFALKPGNNVHINLHPDSRGEADRLFKALSAGGQVDMPLQEMFWGDYFGSFTDQFGMKWMINCASKE